MLLTYLRQNTAQVVEYLGAEALSKSCRAKCSQLRGSMLGIILNQYQAEWQTMSTFCLVTEILIVDKVSETSPRPDPTGQR